MEQTAGLPERSDNISVLAAIYQVERQSGQSATSTMLALWSASSSYLIAGSAVIGYALKELHGPLRHTLIALFPVPAMAFVAYHLILFAISLRRSRSIELLELQLVQSLPADLQRKLYREGDEGIGSRAETNLTGWDRAAPLLKIVSGATYAIPYVGAALIACFAVGNLWKETGFSAWTVASLVTYLIAGVGIVRLAVSLITAPPENLEERPSVARKR